ncbi:unnamed protein product [Rotaria sordida]|uniref:Uncharacterized protein n=1 Tax=Rotaria sordida TaxID=392033 RepID=A0A815PQ67_9BILA|nr:unnamed protein product [Rotaria sordida]CAF1451669.1 unnamed protein product [Rotaria sordida]CAF3672062.1 unnamed protein product [Rotaria sordida]CAF3962787.1 unnamed protein product [Rotaria sordida]
MAQSLYNMGIAEMVTEDYLLSMSHYKDSLLIQLKSIPNHLQTAQTYLTIGVAYVLHYPIEERSNALENFEKALATYEKQPLSLSYPYLTQTLILIGEEL